MENVVELRFEFPNGTVIRALDYEYGFSHKLQRHYRKSSTPQSITLKHYQVEGSFVISMRDFVTIKKAISAKQDVNGTLNATFTYTGSDYKLTHIIKDFTIFSQTVARKVSEEAPEESVLLQFIAKDLLEELE